MESDPFDSSALQGEDVLLGRTSRGRPAALGDPGGSAADAGPPALVAELIQRNFELARRVNELEVALANLSVRTRSPFIYALRRAAGAPAREIRRAFRRLGRRLAGA